MRCLLNVKTRILLEDSDQFLQTDPLTVWNTAKDMRLDYVCAMGDSTGLHAALTDPRNSLGYEFKLQVKPEISFSGKFAQLGADQKEGLLRIGTRPGGEEVYLYMCPQEVVQDMEHAIPPPGLCTGSTRMKTRHARILTIFLAYCLARVRDEVGIYCGDPYTVPLEGPPNWTFTNAL